MDNLEEMDKFLEKYNLPKLNKEEMRNMNRHGNPNCNKRSPTNKSPGPDGITNGILSKV